LCHKEQQQAHIHLVCAQTNQVQQMANICISTAHVRYLGGQAGKGQVAVAKRLTINFQRIQNGTQQQHATTTKTIYRVANFVQIQQITCIESSTLRSSDMARWKPKVGNPTDDDDSDH